jgi:hypothetical protein
MKSVPVLAAASAGGIVAAALAPGLVLFVGSGASREGLEAMLLLFVFGAPLAALHMWFIGLPLYLYLDSRGRMGWLQVALAGFPVGVVPLLLLILLNRGHAGWSAMPGLALEFGGPGLVGGLAFRAIYGPSVERDAI